MIPRLNVSFPFSKQMLFLFGKRYKPLPGEFLVNHARTGIYLALKAAFPNGGRVGVIAYNCHTVVNAIVQAGCTPVFLDVTNKLMLNIDSLGQSPCDGIVLTNLFGIRNDISLIREKHPSLIIVVDNAHGFGLPVEGDFTVYSINQGKFPSLGEGGIFKVNNDSYLHKINKYYETLPSYGIVNEALLFIKMQIKAFLYIPTVYKALTLRIKTRQRPSNYEKRLSLYRMSKGINRMYNKSLSRIGNEIRFQRQNAEQIKRLVNGQDNVLRVWYGENAFMLILECRDVDKQKKWFMDRGIEADTHFKKCIVWNKDFGYIEGLCPTTEQMVKETLMVPTYRTI